MMNILQSNETIKITVIQTMSPFALFIEPNVQFDYNGKDWMVR